jgi:HSP20 family protein
MTPLDPFESGGMHGGASPFPLKAKFAPSRIQWVPAVDIYETETEVVAVAEIPGVRDEDIKTSFSDGILSIEGVKNKVTGLTGLSFFCVERSYGSFKRSFRIVSPVEKDKIRSVFQQGILIIILPKILDSGERE